MQAAGLSYADIGRAVGRNRSLIRQIAIGAKPGENLRGALADIQKRLALVQAKSPRDAARKLAPVQVPRRMSASGRAARVRRPVTVGGRRWSTSTLRRQAARSGGDGLLHSLIAGADADWWCAASVTFGRSAFVRNAYGKTGVEGWGGTAEIELGPCQDVLDELETTGESVTDYIVRALAERGDIELTDDIDSIELRCYPK